MYDITSRDSFTSVAGWMESVEEHASSSITLVIVGHKLDLHEERNVTTEEGKKVRHYYIGHEEGQKECIGKKTRSVRNLT